jgi:hypothetical protein
VFRGSIVRRFDPVIEVNPLQRRRQQQAVPTASVGGQPPTGTYQEWSNVPGESCSLVGPKVERFCNRPSFNLSLIEAHHTFARVYVTPSHCVFAVMAIPQKLCRPWAGTDNLALEQMGEKIGRVATTYQEQLVTCNHFRFSFF